MVVWKDENKQKEAGDGPFKKTFCLSRLSMIITKAICRRSCPHIGKFSTKRDFNLEIFWKQYRPSFKMHNFSLKCYRFFSKQCFLWLDWHIFIGSNKQKYHQKSSKSKCLINNDESRVILTRKLPRVQLKSIVTRCWNKKLPKFSQSSQGSFTLKIDVSK